MKFQTYIVIGTMILILGSAGCEKNEIITDRDYPRLDLNEAINQDESGATFEAIILTNAGEIQDKGFVWNEGTITTSNGSSISLGPGYENGNFTGTAVFDLESGKEYQVKAFVLSEGKTIYSKALAFTSETNGLSHTLTSYAPQTGNLEDTVRITGKNLSYHPDRISVLFNTVSASILSSTDTTISVTVPSSLKENEATIQITIGENIVSFSESFALSDLVIDNIQPTLVTGAGELITITGSGFSSQKENNLVKLGSYSAEVSSATVNRLTVVVPDSFIIDPEVSFDTTVAVKVHTAGNTAIALDSFRFDFNSTWTRMNNLPGNLRKSAMSFGNGLRAYYGLGSNLDESQFYNDLWEYNASNDSWTERSPFPGIPRIYYTSFTLGNHLYLFGGSTGDPSIPENHSLETWTYNMDTDQWNRMNDFVGTARIRAGGFAADGNGYMVSGCHENDTMNLEVWEYLPGSDTWTRKNDLTNVEMMTYDQFLLSAYGNGESGLILCKARSSYTNPDSRVYVPASDSWTGTGFPGTYEGTPPGCYIGDFLYVGPTYYSEVADYNRIYRYDQGGNSWSYLISKAPSRQDAGSFAVGEKLYLLGGLNGSGNGLLNDVWMYDSSK